MPKYKVTSPDGKQYTVTAPDGASQADVMTYAQQHYGQPDKAPAAWQPTKRTADDLRAMAQDHDPTEGNSFLDNAAIGFGKSFVDTGRGLKQAGLEFLEQAAGDSTGMTGSSQMAGLITGEKPGSNAVTRYAHDKLAELQPQIDEARRIDQPVMDTGGGLTGNVAGYVALSLLPAGALRGTVAARALLPATIRGAAALGAVEAGTQPVATGENRVANMAMGAGFGAGGMGAAKGLSAGARAVARLSPEVTGNMQRKAAARVINQFAHDPMTVRAAAANPESIVAGSQPTLAEASGDIGLAGLQRTLANTPEFGNELALRGRANNLARVKTIEESFGGADESTANAIRDKTRTSELPGLREARKQAGAETGRVISWIDRVRNAPRFRNNPGVEGALDTVRNMIATPIDSSGRLSAARGIVSESLSVPRRRSAADFAVIKEARRIVISAQQKGVDADDALKALGKLKPSSVAVMGTINDMRRALKTVEKGRPDVASLYATRMHITQNLMRNADGATMQALRSTIGKLDEQIGAVAPTYKQYLSNFAAGMREADRVDVGAELLGTGRAVRGSTNEPQLTAAAFGRAAGNMDRTVSRATGFPRGTAERTLTKPQMETVDAVRRDLERYSRASLDGKAIGSNTVQNAIGGNRLQSAAGPVGAAMVEPVSGVAMLAINQARKIYGERVGMLVNEAMLDPSRAAEILALVPASQRGDVVRMVAPMISGQLSIATNSSRINQRPLNIDIVGGTSIPEAQARAELGM